MATRPLTDVYSARELGSIVGLPEQRIRAFIATGEISSVDGEFVGGREARAFVLASRNGNLALALGGLALAGGERPPLSTVHLDPRSTGVPLVVSTALHAALVATLVFVTTIVQPTEAVTKIVPDKNPVRMVYLIQPGPGGGGGGGGLKQRIPPPRALRKGPSKLNSPLPRREPPPPLEVVKAPVEEPPPPPQVLKTEPLPPIIAPVVSAPADDRDRPGVMEDTPVVADSRGSGTGGGVGSGEGTGLGEGQGSGIGPGSGGGTGGGPYRPGSGITPPRLLREVKADYTEEGRQKGLSGEVVLEIVVRHDGSVGDVKILQGLGGGLDQRAVAAVRQWRFSPAKRQGTPVDVLVEVAVEFRLR